MSVADGVLVDLHGGEEVGPVLDDGTTGCSPEEVIPADRLLLLAVYDRRKEAGRVQLVVAEELVGAAVELVGSGLGRADDHPAGGPAVLGRVGILYDAKLADRADWWIGA